MPRTLKKSRLCSNKHKSKIKQEIKKTKSILPPHLQSFKENYCQEMVLLYINEL